LKGSAKATGSLPGGTLNILFSALSSSFKGDFLFLEYRDFSAVIF
jgi:hypothetical protein